MVYNFLNIAAAYNHFPMKFKITITSESQI